jgi:hypothetical protein
MAKFGKTSLGRLAGVDYRLQDLAHRIVLEHHDCSVIYGLRTHEEQAKLVQAGLSKTMNSKHLVGKAIDLAPYPIDWDDTKRFYYFSGMVLAMAKEMDIPLRWGGDWDMDNDLNDQTFMDLVHFELTD